METTFCTICGEAVYVGMEDRHMAKDHDPVVDREVKLYSACLALQDDPCDEPYYLPVRNGLVCLPF